MMQHTGFHKTSFHIYDIEKKCIILTHLHYFLILYNILHTGLHAFTPKDKITTHPCCSVQQAEQNSLVLLFPGNVNKQHFSDPDWE